MKHFDPRQLLHPEYAALRTGLADRIGRTHQMLLGAALASVAIIVVAASLMSALN